MLFYSEAFNPERGKPDKCHGIDRRNLGDGTVEELDAADAFSAVGRSAARQSTEK